jgi:polyhydroxyalkanoate synthesis repressor PhaR
MSEAARVEPEKKPAEALPVVVKKYANRRLYNTESSSYITLDNLAEMVRQGRDFVVYDAKTGEDITRGVLTQIIVEEEGKGKAMLPTAFLRQLIGFYGDSVQGLVPRYLEQALAAFGHQQEQMRAAMQKSMGNFFAFGNMEEVGRQNMAMMERALSLFTPFYRPGEAPPGSDPHPGQSPASFDPTQDVAALRAEIEVLRHQLAEARRIQPPAAAAEPSDAAGKPKG